MTSLEEKCCVWNLVNITVYLSQSNANTNVRDFSRAFHLPLADVFRLFPAVLTGQCNFFVFRKKI